MPAFLNIMVDIVDTIPNKKVDKGVKGIYEYQFSGWDIALIVGSGQEGECLQQKSFCDANRKSKKEGDENKAKYLLLNGLDEDMGPPNGFAHQVRQGDSDAEVKEYPLEEFWVEPVKCIGEKHRYQHEKTPAKQLEKPVNRQFFQKTHSVKLLRFSAPNIGICMSG